MDNILRAGDPTYNTIQFEWFLTNWCNYKCSYCSEEPNMKSKFSAGKYKLVLARLAALKHNFNTEIIGGEPTLHPDLLDIVCSLSRMDHCNKIEIVTNLSRPLDYYQNLHLDKVSILASFHPEFYTGKFLEKLSQIKNISVTVNLIDNEKYWDLTESFLSDLKEIHVPFSFNLLTSTVSYKSVYTSKFFNRFGSYLEQNQNHNRIEYLINDKVSYFNETDITRFDLNKFKGYSCTPIRYRITHDGDIKNFCTGRILPFRLTKDIVFKKEVCPNTRCQCDALYCFYKEKL